MTRSLLLIVVAVIGATLVHVAAAAADHPEGVPKDAKKHEGTFTVEHPAFKALKTLTECRDNAKETLTMVQCYEAATTTISYNHSWWASLALLYLRTDQLEKAKTAMDHTVGIWLNENKDFISEAGKKRNVTELPYAHLLRDVFDDGRKEEALEIGMLLAKKFELEEKVGDAHAIYYDFLLQAGTGAQEVLEFHRNTGNLLAMVMSGTNLSETSILWRLAEAYQPAVEAITSHLMRMASPMKEPVKRMCGIEFSQNEDLRSVDLIQKMTSCLQNWGNLSVQLQSEDEKLASIWTSIMQEAPIHRFAALGVTYVLEKALAHFEGKFMKADRAGRGALHHACAHGRTETAKMLLRGLPDKQINEEDKGRITPKILGCGTLGYKKEFEEEILGGDCTGFERGKMDGEDIDITDDSGADGDWNPKRKRPKYLHCDFDVRDASSMTQSDLMLAYTHSSHPVILRNSFYDTDGPDRKWRFKNFKKEFGKVLLRQEKFAVGERWGLGAPNITTVEAFLATLNVADGTIGDVAIDLEKHPLYELADRWVPPTYETKKKLEDVSLFDAKQAAPILNIVKDSSRGFHQLRSQQTYRAVVYGHEEWTLLPPRHSRTLKGVVDLKDTLKPFSFRCDVFTGDVLVIPEMWSAGWHAKAHGVAIERPVYRNLKYE